MKTLLLSLTAMVFFTGCGLHYVDIPVYNNHYSYREHHVTPIQRVIHTTRYTSPDPSYRSGVKMPARHERVEHPYPRDTYKVQSRHHKPVNERKIVKKTVVQHVQKPKKVIKKTVIIKEHGDVKQPRKQHALKVEKKSHYADADSHRKHQNVEEKQHKQKASKRWKREE